MVSLCFFYVKKNKKMSSLESIKKIIETGDLDQAEQLLITCMGHEIEDLVRSCIDETKILQIRDVFCMYFGEQNVWYDTVHTEEIIKTIARDVTHVYTKEIFDEMSLPAAARFGEDSEQKRYVCSMIQSNGFNIIVRWPSITVTNEIGDNTDIYDLFCIVECRTDGTLYDILFTRSTYTIEQFESGYIHSHIPKFSAPISDNVNDVTANSFLQNITNPKHFCFGQGPIRNTISLLKTKCISGTLEENYLLLCRELDICVRVESLAGVPYTRISSIGAIGTRYKYSKHKRKALPQELPKDFIVYFLKNMDIKYVFVNNHVKIGMSFDKFSIMLTRLFLEYAKQHNLDSDEVYSYITEAIIKEDKIMVANNYADDYADIERWIANHDNTVITFKNTPFKIKLFRDRKRKQNKTFMIKSSYASYIYDLVGLIANSNTNDLKTKENDQPRQDSAEKSVDEHKKVYCSFAV